MFSSHRQHSLMLTRDHMNLSRGLSQRLNEWFLKTRQWLNLSNWYISDILRLDQQCGSSLSIQRCSSIQEDCIVYWLDITCLTKTRTRYLMCLELVWIILSKLSLVSFSKGGVCNLTFYGPLGKPSRQYHVIINEP